MNKASTEKPLTTAELAARWNMESATLDIWRQRGKGPKFMKISEGVRGRVMYSMQDVLDYERERTKKSTKPAK